MDFNGYGGTTLTERARCPECGGWFTRATSEHWKRLCLDCFIARKRSQESEQESRIAGLHERIDALSEQVEELEEENTSLRNRVAELEHGPQAKPQIGRFEAQFMEIGRAHV